MVHGLLTPEDGIHVPYSYTYASESERAAATLPSSAVGKLALQTDTKVLYVCTAVAPTTWSKVGDLSSTDISGSGDGQVLKISGSLLVRKCEFAQIVDPTASDDASQGYGAGSLWVRYYLGDGGTGASTKLWICVSPVVGNARWFELQALTNLLTNAVAPGACTRSASMGVDVTAARADHSHDRAKLLYATITASASMTEVDSTMVDPTSGDVVVTLLPSSVAVSGAARTYQIVKTALTANKIIVARSGSDTIRGLPTQMVLPGSDEYARGVWELTVSGTNWVLTKHYIDYPEPSELTTGFVGAWYAEPAYLTLSSNRVSAWIDSYGSGRSFAQATATVQPYYRSSGGPGGRGSLWFDATRDTTKGDYLELAHEAGWSSTTTWTVIVVSGSVGQSNVRYLVNKTTSSAPGAFDFILSQNYTLGQCPGLSTASSFVVTGAPGGSNTPGGQSINTWDIVGFTSDGSAGGAKVFSAGRKLTEATFTPTANAAPIRVGRRIDGTANGGFHGDVSAMLIWSRALTEAEMISQLKFLKRRYP